MPSLIISTDAGGAASVTAGLAETPKPHDKISTDAGGAASVTASLFDRTSTDAGRAALVTLDLRDILFLAGTPATQNRQLCTYVGIVVFP